MAGWPGWLVVWLRVRVGLCDVCVCECLGRLCVLGGCLGVLVGLFWVGGCAGGCVWVGGCVCVGGWMCGE